MSLFVFCAVWLTGAGVQAARPKHQLKIATVAPEGSTWMRVMREIDSEVREATNSSVGFKIYAGGVQGDERVVLRKIRSGQLHGGGFTGLGLGMIAPELRVIELPFLLDSNQQVDAVYDKLSGGFAATLESNGYVLLGWAEVGFVYLFSKNPIANQGDLQSAKMWLWEGDPLAEAFYKSAGVVPVPLAITDVMTSLQTGLINAVYSSPLGCLALQWFTRVKYVTDVPITFASGAVVVSKKAFQKIPAAQRDTVKEICRRRFRGLVEETRKQNRAAFIEIEKAGVQRVEVSGEQLARFRKAGRSVWEEEVGELYSEALLDSVRSVVDN